MPERVDVGLLVAHAPSGDAARLRAFAQEVADAAARALAEATGTEWRFHATDATRLADDDPRRPSDFLDEASLRMVEGPYDAVVVVTDVSVSSRRSRVEAALASRPARVVVLSARKLLVTPRGKPQRALEAPDTRANAVALLLHELGHVVGAPTARGDDVMAPFEFVEGRRGAPPFGPRTRAAFRAFEGGAHERAVRGGPLAAFAFHLATFARHPGVVLTTVARARAPLLPLRFAGLATAAVAPVFILVFTAEIWDVGLNLPTATATGFAAAAVLAAAVWLVRTQDLLFPRTERRVLTEPMAVVNASVFLTMLVAMAGLFAMLVVLTLAVELYVFPPGLIATWPTLEDPEVTFGDKLRLASFIATVGTLTGALAGGLESRTALRNLALFRDRP